MRTDGKNFRDKDLQILKDTVIDYNEKKNVICLFQILIGIRLVSYRARSYLFPINSTLYLIFRI